jgi:hypothetical protein
MKPDLDIRPTGPLASYLIVYKIYYPKTCLRSP